METPSGPCWVELNCPPPPCPPLPAGTANGDRLVWVDGTWVVAPAVAPQTSGPTKSPDTIFGFISRAADAAHLVQWSAARGVPLDHSKGYYCDATGEVSIYDADSGSWSVYDPQEGSEFVDIPSGNIYPLRSLKPSQPSTGLPVPHGASDGDHLVWLSGRWQAVTAPPVPQQVPVPQHRAFTIGDGAMREFLLIHGYETEDVFVEIYDTSTGTTSHAGIVDRINNNTVRVRYPSPPHKDQYRVLVRI